MKAAIPFFLTCAVILSLSGWLIAADKEAKTPTAVCPISGKAINKGVSIDYQGGKLYFCCPGCIAKFNADQAKHAAKANLQMVLTGQAKQTACPISGEPTDPESIYKVGGVDVQFCCGKCIAKVKKAKPEEQLEMIFGKNFSKAFAVKKS